MSKQEQEFLAQSCFAVVGASNDRAKFGNKVLRCYLQHRRDAVPIHPKEGVVEGVQAYPSLSDMPDVPDAVSIITPPVVTEKVVEECGRLGIRHVWMQPGAESPAAVKRAQELGINTISGGPCLLVVLGFRDV
jgi:uncharacterized protein